MFFITNHYHNELVFFNCIDDDPKYDKMSRTKDRAANIEDSSVGFAS